MPCSRRVKAWMCLVPIFLAPVVSACSGETSPLPGGQTGCNGVTSEQPFRGHMHIDEPAPITYVDVPPSSGDHRPVWARWGEYLTLPPERWVHNLEHGGIALLYSETATSTTVSELRAYARGRLADGGGPFRYVMTPYPGLPSKIAAVAWLWTYEADSVCPGELEAFVSAHYRMASEDIAADGLFADQWQGR